MEPLQSPEDNNDDELGLVAVEGVQQIMDEIAREIAADVATNNIDIGYDDLMEKNDKLERQIEVLDRLVSELREHIRKHKELITSNETQLQSMQRQLDRYTAVNKDTGEYTNVFYDRINSYVTLLLSFTPDLRAFANVARSAFLKAAHDGFNHPGLQELVDQCTQELSYLNGIIASYVGQFPAQLTTYRSYLMEILRIVSQEREKAKSDIADAVKAILALRAAGKLDDNDETVATLLTLPFPPYVLEQAMGMLPPMPELATDAVSPSDDAVSPSDDAVSPPGPPAAFDAATLPAAATPVKSSVSEAARKHTEDLLKLVQAQRTGPPGPPAAFDAATLPAAAATPVKSSVSEAARKHAEDLLKLVQAQSTGTTTIRPTPVSDAARHGTDDYLRQFRAGGKV